MNKHKKYLVFLFLMGNSCLACEETGQLEKYIEESYIYKTVEETRNIVHSEIKKVITSRSLSDMNPKEVEKISISLSDLKNRFTNISMGKLRLEPNKPSPNGCSFFLLGVQSGIVKDSINEVSKCIAASCPKDEQDSIIEDLLLKATELDKNNASCLELLKLMDAEK